MKGKEEINNNIKNENNNENNEKDDNFFYKLVSLQALIQKNIGMTKLCKIYNLLI